MSRCIGDILVLGSAASWGASHPLVKKAIRELPGFNLVGMRFTIAGRAARSANAIGASIVGGAVLLAGIYVSEYRRAPKENER